MSSSVKMEDLLPHTTVDMVALAHASASPHRRSVRRSPPRYSPPPALDTIGSVGVRPVTPFSRRDPRRDGARARVRVRGSGASRSRLAGRRRRGFSDGEWVGQFGLVLMVQSYTSCFFCGRVACQAKPPFISTPDFLCFCAVFWAFERE
jgi:hypothetical protein